MKAISMKKGITSIIALSTLVVSFTVASVSGASDRYTKKQAPIGSRDVPRIALMRDASIKDFQIAKIPGNDGTTAAPFVGSFWDCSNVEDPGFDFCDLKLVFCPKPGEEGCWVID